MAGGELDAFMGFSKLGTAETGPKQKVPQIVGETQDAIEQEWAKDQDTLSASIQIKGYEFGFSTDCKWDEERVTMRDGEVGGNHGHYPDFDEVTVSKVFDSASPKLLEAVYYAACYDLVQLWQRRAGADLDAAGGYYFWAILKDVTVNSVRWTTSENSPYPEETIKLGFRSIKVNYIPQLTTGELETQARVHTEHLAVISKDAKSDGDKEKHTDKGKGKAKDHLSDSDLEKKILAILKRNHFRVGA